MVWQALGDAEGDNAAVRGRDNGAAPGNVVDPAGWLETGRHAGITAVLSVGGGYLKERKRLQRNRDVGQFGGCVQV